MPARFFENHRKLELVIEFFGEMLRINHRLIGPNNSVHILKKYNPGKHGVGETCFLGFFAMLAKIASGVEEFLWGDRRLDLYFVCSIENPFAPGASRPGTRSNRMLERRAGGV